MSLGTLSQITEGMTSDQLLLKLTCHSRIWTIFRTKAFQERRQEELRKQKMAEEQEAGSMVTNTANQLGELSPDVQEAGSATTNTADQLGDLLPDVVETGSMANNTAADVVEVITSSQDSSQDNRNNVENSVYCHLGNSIIGRHDYLTLRPGTQLNDEVINGMLHFEAQDIASCHLFPTHFLERYLNPVGANQPDSFTSLGERRHAGVSRWTRGINLVAKKVVLIPVNWDNHWYLIAATNMDGIKTDITVLNSVEGVGNVDRAVAAVKEYLWFECLLDNFRVITPRVPSQISENDCGIFTILYARFLLASLDDFQVLALAM